MQIHHPILPYALWVALTMNMGRSTLLLIGLSVKSIRNKVKLSEVPWCYKIKIALLMHVVKNRQKIEKPSCGLYPLHGLKVIREAMGSNGANN